jgi:hypothetical protein
MLPPSSDDEFYGVGDDEDSDDSNYNGFHPCFVVTAAAVSGRG